MTFELELDLHVRVGLDGVKINLHRRSSFNSES